MGSRRLVWLMHTLAVLLTALQCVSAQSADNWFPTFFWGQNQPPDDKINVYLSAFLWRVTDVNELDYTFTAHLRYTLTWVEPGAAELIANATQRQRDAEAPCRRPCTNVHYPAGDPGVQVPVLDNSVECCDDLWLPTLLVDNVLTMPQANYYSSCDDLWLPTLIVDNVVEMPQTNMYSRISLCNGEQDALLWTVKVVGVFYTSMNFRAFPFDQQLLTIVFRVPENINYTSGHITYIPSVAAISNRFQQGIENGDDLAGFSVSAMYFNEFSEDWFSVFRSVTPPAPGDHCPFDPTTKRNGAYVTTNYTSISVVIQVNRYSWYYVWTVILPVTLVGLMGFAIFWFQPSDVVTRFQAIVTLFLALMAVQFVVNAELPASSYALPTQQFIIATYVLYLLLTAESFLVYKIVLTKERKDAEAKQAEAVRMWKAAQQDKEKDKLMQRKASTIIAMMKPGRGKSGMSMGNPATRGSQGSLSNGAEEGHPDATIVVPVASTTDAGVSDGDAPIGRAPMGKGWAALRGAGAVQVAQAVQEPDQGGEGPFALTDKGAEVDGHGAPALVQQDEDDVAAGSKQFQHWMQRRKMSDAVAAKDEEEDGVAPNDHIMLCPFFPRMRKKVAKPRRQSVQEYLYHWRARRYDKVLGSLLFVAYIVTGVLLFAIPAAIYN